jgi:hypothetical protein
MDVRYCLFLLLIWPHLAIPLHAAEVLERHIDVRFRQTPLREALEEVSKKAAFEWSYNANIVDATKRISFMANDWTVREILYEILGDGYEFKSNGNYLILKKRKKPAGEIFGYVKDPATGQRIAHATVYDRRTLRATSTDSNGYYELKVKKRTEIAIARLDYRDTIFVVTSQASRLQKIDLQIDSSKRQVMPKWEQWVENASTGTERFFRATVEKWSDRNVRDSIHRRFQMSLLPKLGTNHNLSGKVVNDWSLNVLAGSSYGNQKLEIGGLGNFTRKDIKGVQIGGVFNEVQGTTKGLQIGGIYNRTADTLAGLQIGGVINLSRQASSETAQIAGLYNQNRAGILRFQIAGAANLADTVQGFQIAGVFNHANKVRGFQIGLINSAREVKGLQIGLLNRSGRRVLPFFNW